MLTPAIVALSKFVCPSTSKSWVTVVKPAMLTLSKLVWPSTSKSPVTVVFPVTSRPALQSTLPAKSVCVPKIVKISTPLWAPLTLKVPFELPII